MANAPEQLDLSVPEAVDVHAEADRLVARLPDLLIQARFISTTVAHGIHGRRRAGPGETFWQFRRFNSGEPAQRIDWRRSARDDYLYVREKEWEAAHTVWLWLDRSPSMYFRSSLSPVRKIDRAVVLTLAFAELLVRGGERVGVVGLARPSANRQTARRIAEVLASAPVSDDGLESVQGLGRHSELVAISDYLEKVDDLAPQIERIAGESVNGHLLQVLDPAEETFPFAGRTEFRDPSGQLQFIAGRAETMRDVYQARMADRRRRLRAITERLGWSKIVHHTDTPAQAPLLAVHQRLSGSHEQVVIHGRPWNAPPPRLVADNEAGDEA